MDADAAAAAAAHLLGAVHELYARANATDGTSDPTTQTRPPVYKAIGISLAIGSGFFIGTSFVLKKVGLLKANEKYNETAGEGYGYLKNAFWWGGMTLMILGETLNFVAYAFTDAILVTPLGALSVVITTILSAIFLKERLSMVGKVACFLCIVGSIVIVMNAPQESSVADIQQMQRYVITPGFLVYTGVIIAGAVFAAFWAGPRYGKKNMLVYISICSWVGGLSVVATQGLGSAIIAQASGTPQFNQWFIYVLLVFVICTLLTEIVFLNKALNLFNAALVTPTYYVYFTSTTIITSAVLFQGFKGSVTSIVTVVNGFLTICAGVVLLQLSKSAKDVPDVAVFKGDLDQIYTIAEQEQPETEPKADAIRGAAAIVRRLSTARQKREVEELKRLHQETIQERLETVSEDGQPEYEWDGLRRRKTLYGSQRSRAMTSPTHFAPGSPKQQHPPLGMSHFPTDEELAAMDRPMSPVLSSIVGTIQSRARSVLFSGHSEYHGDDQHRMQSPTHPVQLTEISVPAQKTGEALGPHYNQQSNYGLPVGNTAYEGRANSISSSKRRVQFSADDRLPSRGSDFSTSMAPPTPPPHLAKRQFSFQNIFKRHQQQASTSTAGDGACDDHVSHHQQSLGRTRPVITSRGYSNPHTKGATEEERLGLVKGNSRNSQSMPALPHFGDEEDDGDEGDEEAHDLYDDMQARHGRNATLPRRGSNEKDLSTLSDEELLAKTESNESTTSYHGYTPPPPPPPPPLQPAHRLPSSPKGGKKGGAFI